jgi:hypothetical protein
MKEGDKICFRHDHRDKCGTIIKIFTQIGFENHGKEFVVIMPEYSRGLFNKHDIKIEKNKLKII